MNNDDLSVLVTGGGRLLSKHVYCGHRIKMTERVEQQICIKICVKLEHSFVETIQIIQKAAAMGNC